MGLFIIKNFSLLMNELRNKEIKVGIISSLAIILLIVGISIGNDWNVSTKYTKIKFRFNNSGGIEQSAPVFVNGVKRGTVIKVSPDHGSVLITANIDKIDDLKNDLTAIIAIKEITGGKKIDISSGNSQIPFNQKNEIIGTTSPDIGDLIALVGEMSGDAKSLLKKLDTIATAVNAFLNNDANLKNIQNTISNTDEMVKNIKDFTNNNISNLNQIVSNLKTITKNINSDYSEYKPKFDSSFNKIQITLNDADDAINSANLLLKQFNNISVDINNSKGLISKLIYDKKFASKLDSTLIDLSKFLKQIKKYGININARLGTRP